MIRFLILTLILGAGCAVPPPSPDWDSEMSLALSARGKTLAEQGDRPAGKRLAEEALALAHACGSKAAQARSLALLAWIDHSYAQAEESLGLLDSDAASPETWDLRLLLADLALDQPAAGEPQIRHWARLALEHAQEVYEPAAELDDLVVRAEYEGTARHLAAVALRRLGAHGEASYQERQAALVLTLLPDEALLTLRLQVLLGRGNDLAREREFEAAFLKHMQAQTLARQLEDPAAEMDAMAGRSADLAGLGRLVDAAQTASTLADLALSRDAVTRARSSAQRGLAWLEATDPFGHQPLRLSLLACLREVDARVRPAQDSAPTIR